MKLTILEPDNPYNHPEELFVKANTAVLPLQSSEVDELGYKAWYSYINNELTTGYWEPEELEAEQKKIQKWLEIAKNHSIYGGLYEIGMNYVFYNIVVYKKQVFLIEHKESREGCAIDSDGHWYYEACRVSKIKI